LVYIFKGTHATRQLWYASTQSPSDSVEEQRGVNLNLLPGIIDLMELECNPPRGKIGKSKRAGSPIRSQPASKRFVEDAVVVEKITSKLDCMREHFESFYVNSTGGSNSNNARSSRPSPQQNPPTRPPVAQDPIAVAMPIFNRMRDQLKLDVASYVRVCKFIVAQLAMATMLIHMEEDGQRQWLLEFKD
jgi:hypothetical protein